MYMARGAAMILRQENGVNPLVDESARRTQAFAFLSIFHPELGLEDRLRMANEIARREPRCQRSRMYGSGRQRSRTARS